MFIPIIKLWIIINNIINKKINDTHFIFIYVRNEPVVINSQVMRINSVFRIRRRKLFYSLCLGKKKKHKYFWISVKN